MGGSCGLEAAGATGFQLPAGVSRRPCGEVSCGILPSMAGVLSREMIPVGRAGSGEREARVPRLPPATPGAGHPAALARRGELEPGRQYWEEAPLPLLRASL